MQAVGFRIEGVLMAIQQLPLLQDTDDAVEVTYQVCTHCGFRLMHVLPPTRKTFPFPVVYCPVCEMRRDEHGFHPGKNLNEEERREALRRWLLKQGLDEITLAERYRLSLDHFFEPLSDLEHLWNW